ncbi:MAG TPA: twin transmembrane helix small protein [Thermohalobaculum sp.]|nr:twin transmembrane helix small protein [Thermohalobaculum sp.]
MSGMLFYLAGAACLVTFGVLAYGIGGFGSKSREGVEGARFSNRLMRYRIIAQAVAIILILLTVWAVRGGN